MSDRPLLWGFIVHQKWAFTDVCFSAGGPVQRHLQTSARFPRVSHVTTPAFVSLSHVCVAHLLHPPQRREPIRHSEATSNCHQRPFRSSHLTRPRKIDFPSASARSADRVLRHHRAAARPEGKWRHRNPGSSCSGVLTQPCFRADFIYCYLWHVCFLRLLASVVVRPTTPHFCLQSKQIVQMIFILLLLVHNHAGWLNCCHRPGLLAVHISPSGFCQTAHESACPGEQTLEHDYSLLNPFALCINQLWRHYVALFAPLTLTAQFVLNHIHTGNKSSCIEVFISIRLHLLCKSNTVAF